MKIKEFIRLFVPPVYYKVKKRLFLRKEPKIYPLPKLQPQGDKLIIIGNGPSLNQSMKLSGDIICSTPCVMVNFSARTPLFEQIKPKYYVMVDPGFIENKKLSSSINALVDDICNKTSWPMTIVMPDSLKTWNACIDLRMNKNITVLFYNNRWRNVQKDLLFEAWDNNTVNPPAQTVLNTAIWLSIYCGYKETYLIGADTSFIQDIYVGQKDNVLYTIDRHFYDNQEVCPQDIDPKKNGRPFGMTMEQLLDAVHTMYEDYKTLKAYADWKGVKIYNASEYSMIDCFERKKLSE